MPSTARVIAKARKSPKSVMPKHDPDSPSQKLFDTIADEYVSEAAGVTKSRMMGVPCIKVKTKMFCGIWRDAMIFKLTGDVHTKALALQGAHLFDPSAMNRPMKEWVVVPFTHKSKWRSYTAAALAYVASLT